jgi:Spy/CpxP family protein refolding chaperone
MMIHGSSLARRLLLVAVVGATALPVVAGDGAAPSADDGSGRGRGDGRGRGGGGRRHGEADGEKKGRGGKMSDDERAALRERVQQKIQTYLTVELSSRAGLDDKKALQLGAAIKTQLQQRQAAREKKRAEMKKLRELVESKAADAALKAQVKAVVDQGDREEQLQSLLDETSKFLTPTEQAKVVVAWPEVMKETRRLIAKARRDRGGAGDDEE